jgi:hypothetical protein
MLGMLADLAVDTLGNYFVELFASVLIRPLQRPRPEAKSGFGLI